jgi:mannose-6-phosphate isomerase-like protein (cupin superfamily)
MKKVIASLLFLISFSAAVSFLLLQQRAQASEGYIIEHDAEVAREEGGPHKGLGRSTGYVFFGKAPDLKFSFRKRVLHSGSSIGYHLQDTDEVYYVVSGNGKMTINGKEFSVKPGDAILTRKGSSHGLVQTGDQDLTIIISYDK